MAEQAVKIQSCIQSQAEIKEEWTLTGMENAAEGEFSIYKDGVQVGSALNYNCHSIPSCDGSTGSEGGGYLEQGGWWKFTWTHGYEPTTFVIYGPTGDCVNYTLTKTQSYSAAVVGQPEKWGIGGFRIKIDGGAWSEWLWQWITPEDLGTKLGLTVEGTVGNWTIVWPDENAHTVELDGTGIFGWEAWHPS